MDAAITDRLIVEVHRFDKRLSDFRQALLPYMS